jgi:hypothetical protein
MPPFAYNSSLIDPRVSPVRVVRSGGTQPGGPGTDVAANVAVGTYRLIFINTGGIYLWDFVEALPGTLIGYWHPSGAGIYNQFEIRAPSDAAGADNTGLSVSGLIEAVTWWDIFSNFDTQRTIQNQSVAQSSGYHYAIRAPDTSPVTEFDVLITRV